MCSIKDWGTINYDRPRLHYNYFVSKFYSWTSTKKPSNNHNQSSAPPATASMPQKLTKAYAPPVTSTFLPHLRKAQPEKNDIEIDNLRK